MDLQAVIAEKDAEILVLRQEIAELKLKLDQPDLEEMEIDTDVSEDVEPMKLKLPEDPEDESPNIFQNPTAIMQFMQMMMGNQMNASQEESSEEEDIPELELIDDVIPDTD